MNQTLSSWNESSESAALEAMLACCGARRWATAMVATRPIATVMDLQLAADRIWVTMQEPDWMEAFACHPRIGDRKAPHASQKSIAWSRQEQSSAASAPGQTLSELAAGNTLYEQRFGFTYIVCATGKTAEEMLAILNRRLANDRTAELHEAAEQQRQITQIRLRKGFIE